MSAAKPTHPSPNIIQNPSQLLFPCMQMAYIHTNTMTARKTGHSDSGPRPKAPPENRTPHYSTARAMSINSGNTKFTMTFVNNAGEHALRYLLNTTTYHQITPSPPRLISRISLADLTNVPCVFPLFHFALHKARLNIAEPLFPHHAILSFRLHDPARFDSI